MLLEFSEYLDSNCRLIMTRPILIGVSGGSDSICLLHLLKSLGYLPIVAHMNHRLRPGADEDVQIVTQLAETLEVPLVIQVHDVKTLAKTSKLSIEEAARTLRYRFLFEQAQVFNAQAVAVGHIADDQVETVMMHLLRGTGLAGLRGMLPHSLPNAWSQDIPLVRPLLGFWREDVLEYCTQYNLRPVQDESNLDTTYFRNRIRHDLIPYLEQYYNPGIKKLFWRMANTLASEYNLLNQLGEAAWQSCVAEIKPGCVTFYSKVLRNQPMALQRLLVRRAIAILCPELRDVDYETTERAIKFISNSTLIHTAHCDLLAGLHFMKENDNLGIFTDSGYLSDPDNLSKDWPQMLKGGLICVPVPGKVVLPPLMPGSEGSSQGWLFSVEWVDDILGVLAQVEENHDPYQAWLDVSDQVKQIPSLYLEIRCRHPGDRFQPLGLDGHSLKLSDFMLNEKIPRRARAGWPLVCLNSQVIWIPGYRISHANRLTQSTKHAVHLCLTCVDT